jgi:hypothetical protein
MADEGDAKVGPTYHAAMAFSESHLFTRRKAYPRDRYTTSRPWLLATMTKTYM